MAGGKVIASVAAVCLAFGGYVVYQDNFSDSAHVKQQCTAAWKSQRADTDAMTASFDKGPSDSTVADITSWLHTASALRHTLAVHGDCFLTSHTKLAEDQGYYLTAVDTAALDRAISCVQMARRID